MKWATLFDVKTSQGRRFSGVIPPLSTPFLEDGSIDWKAIEVNLGLYADTGLGGFLVLGSTGEALHLSPQERLEVVKFTASRLPAEHKFLVGLPFHSCHECLHFIERLEKISIDGLLISVPFYYRNFMSPEALKTYFETVADQSPFPLLLYNFPQSTGIELSAKLVGNLARHPNIVGMKDSSGNLRYLQSVLLEIEETEFELINGSAEVIWFSQNLGMRAGIYALACAFPSLLVRFVERITALKENKETVEGIRARQLQIFRLASRIVGRLGIPGLKYAMQCNGYHGGFPRTPLLPLLDVERQEVDQLVGSVLVSS